MLSVIGSFGRGEDVAGVNTKLNKKTERDEGQNTRTSWTGKKANAAIKRQLMDS